MKKTLLTLTLVGTLCLQAVAPMTILGKPREEAGASKELESREEGGNERILRELASLSGEKTSVKKEVNGKGSEVFSIQEGSLKETLEIKKNGDIYLDGRPVYFADYDAKEDLIQKVRINVDQKNYERDLKEGPIEDYSEMFLKNSKTVDPNASLKKEVDPEGNILYHVQEGKIKNTLEIKKNGDMYLDGVPTYQADLDDQGDLIRKVRINALEEDTPEALKALEGKDKEDSKPKARLLKNLPEGLTDDDLKESLGGYHKNISFEKPLKEVTYPVFEFIQLKALGISGQEKLGTYREIYEKLEEKNSKTVYLTYRGAKRKGNSLGNYLAIEKVYREIYTNEKHTGYLGNNIFYLGYYE